MSDQNGGDPVTPQGSPRNSNTSHDDQREDTPRDDPPEDLAEEVERLRAELALTEQTVQENERVIRDAELRQARSELEVQLNQARIEAQNTETAVRILQRSTAPTATNSGDGGNGTPGTNDSNAGTNPGTQNNGTTPNNASVAASSQSMVSIDLVKTLIETIQNSARPAEPKPAVFKEQPPFFNGQDEDCIVWLKNYDAAARKNNWKDADKVRHLTTALRGPAKVWYEGKYDDLVPEWADFRTEFLRAFKPGDYELDMRIRFQTTKQGFAERPVEFLNRLLKMRNQIQPKPSDDELIACLKRGLELRYAQHILQKDNIEDIRTLLAELQGLSERRDNTRARNNFNPERNNRQFIPNRNRPNVGYTGPNHYNNSAQRPPNRTEKQEFKPTCYNCGKVGHLSSVCRAPYDKTRFNENKTKFETARKAQAPPVRKEPEEDPPKRTAPANNYATARQEQETIPKRLNEETERKVKRPRTRSSINVVHDQAVRQSFHTKPAHMFSSDIRKWKLLSTQAVVCHSSLPN